MAGETRSLDFVPLPSGLSENELHAAAATNTTPLYPGYQLRHIVDDRRGDAWVVARVTRRISQRDALLGIAEEVHIYPTRYDSEAEAEAAVPALYAQDGPGDPGEYANQKQAIADKAAAEKPAAAAASSYTHTYP